MNKKPHKTSWEPVGSWYDKCVGKEGQYYHQKIVIPGVLDRLRLEKDSSVLDLACGQGILARALPKETGYCGIDISPTLIKSARSMDRQPNHEYLVGDISEPLPVQKNDFTHAAIILALQNIENGREAIKQASLHLCKGGRLVIVLNHPCFRIPRQSAWGVDEGKKLQYRRLDRYYTPLSIPIQAHPSQGEQSENTWSYHNPLSAYVSWLNENGFLIAHLDEWRSDKKSLGSAAKMENRAREEFPLFLCITAISYK